MPNFDNYPGTPPAQAYSSGATTVGTTATLICTPPANPTGVIVQNNGAVAVILGSATVTATTGISIAAGATLTIPTLGDAQCQLYGITASSTASVSYLYPQA